MAKTSSTGSSRPVSLKDIARELDVSYSLVSKVLNERLGTTGVRPEVKETILRKAREMNYRPNPLATALKRGRQGAVGVLIHPIGEEGTEIASKLLNGISDELAEHRLRLWLRFYKTGREFIENIRQTARHEMDGMIVVGFAHGETFDLISKLHAGGLPIVSVFEYQSIPGISNVAPDPIQQGFVATDHLLAQGCRRIGHLITDFQEGPRTIKMRVTGYHMAHQQHGVAVDPDLLFNAPDYKLRTGENAVRHWLERGIKFDGIVAQSDHQAIGAIHELLRRGISVPEKVRVIGVDDSPLCNASPVPLSSVSAEWIQVGLRAADMIMAEINGRTPAPSLSIGPRLAVRRSSDPNWKTP